MKDYFLHIFEYNKWANNLINKSLKENKISGEKIFTLFSHIIIAQILWLNRIKKEPYEFKDFWSRLSPGKMEVLYKRSNSDWISFITTHSEEDLRKTCSYVNSKGNNCSNTMAQIITHVINHSTYHRAQIALLLRTEGINPPLTDYIAFFRK
jgi:uncharacterized damage-inducible protein DinB